MSVNIDEQKKLFLEICSDKIHREGMDKLLDWLEKSDFYRAPASSKYHGAYEGGLCEHSLDVLEQALKIVPILPQKIDDVESLAIACLFHDVCKVNYYKPDKRNKKVNGTWVEVPFFSVEEKFHFGGHGSKSVFILQQFIKLKPEEAVAINCHMGFADCGPSNVGDISNAFEQYPLAWLVHVADEAATYLLNRKAEDE